MVDLNLLSSSSHPVLYRVVAKVDQFRASPDTKGGPTVCGLALTLLVVPAVLVLYFYYIFVNNATVYATTVLHAGSSQWSGQSTCYGQGGCFFAASYRGNSCVPYGVQDISYVGPGATFSFDASDFPPQYSDGSNADVVPALLMVASVNQTAAEVSYSHTLSSQSVWSLRLRSATVAQGTTLSGGLSVAYTANPVNPFTVDVRGTNSLYSVKLVIDLASVVDEVDTSVSAGTAPLLGLGVTATCATQATFTENADVVDACMSNPSFQHSPIVCSAPMACVTATVTLNPVVTSTTIYKQNSLTGLFAQVGGNASNAVFILTALMSVYHSIRQRWMRNGATVAAVDTQPVLVKPQDVV
jgi:hypothetical protein